MQANSPLEQHSVEGDPLFVNAGSGVFSLNAGSPAVDGSTAGTGTTVYADFLSTFSLSIAVDFNGAARPANAIWDMGAFEGAEATSDPRAYSLRLKRRR